MKIIIFFMFCLCLSGTVYAASDKPVVLLTFETGMVENVGTKDVPVIAHGAVRRITHVARNGTGAAALDGFGNFLEIALDTSPTAMPELSWGAWICLKEAGARTAILTHDNGGFDRTLGTDTRGTGETVRWSVFDGEGVVADGPSRVPLRAWTHVAATYSQHTGTMHFYVNGVDTLGPIQTQFDASVDGATFVGGNVNFGQYMRGHVDDVFIYDRVLSPAEVSEIVNAGFTTRVPLPLPLVLMIGAVGTLVVLRYAPEAMATA